MKDHRVPSYRLHRPSGQAVVTLSDRDHYLGPWNTAASKDEYDRLIGEWLANGRNLPANGCNDSLTITEVVAAYWEFAKGYYVKDGKPTGQLPGVKVALRILRQRYGKTLAREFSPLSLKALQDQMIEAGHCRRYINDNCGRIKRMFKWAVAQEMVPVAVYQALSTVPSLKRGRTIARESDPVRPVSDADVNAALPFMSGVVRAMVQIQRLTGCRPGEIRIMRPCDVATESDEWMFRPRTHKTEHREEERRIYIGPKAQAILRPFLQRDGEEYCFSPAESVAELLGRQNGVSNGRPKHSRKPGRHYTKDSYNRAIARACRKARIDPWSPNQLRHSRATELRSQFGLEAAQTVLGHSQADVTQVYAERDFDLARRIMLDIG